MNEFEREVAERKRIARGAHNHINARRGRCKLPHDGMTRKEWEKMNGEVQTVNTKKPMAWAEFKALPKSLQELYYNTVAEEYGASHAQMAQMFGTGRVNLQTYIEKHGLEVVERTKGGRMSQTAQFRWWQFIQPIEKKDIDQASDVKEAYDAALRERMLLAEVAPPNEDGVIHTHSTLTRYTLDFTADCWADVFATLLQMPIPTGAHIRVVVE